MARVLVVEDEPLVRMATVDLVLGSGLIALEASTADEALQVIRDDADIGLVITDVDMPGSMDGAELAFVLDSQFPHLKVAVVSGVAVRLPLPDGVPYFTKPLDERLLTALLGAFRARDGEAD